MKRIIAILLILIFSFSGNAQELFPIAEPASSVPGGAFGVRVFSKGYKEAAVFRNMVGLRLLYGVTPKLSLYFNAAMSDFHSQSLPLDFIDHGHNGTQQTGSVNSPQPGANNPILFNSMSFYAKYRFVTSDGPNTHFRMAGYAEGAYVALPSPHAEPDLQMHTSGMGAGIITTYLKKHFAASLTTGFVLPVAYKGNATDKFGGIYPTVIRYGNAVNYSLSFGYLLLPRSYKSYKQLNWNLYLEFTGKAFGAATVSQKDGPDANALPIVIPDGAPVLRAGNYMDVNPGIQCIVNSIYRIEATVALPMVSQSYTHQYPVYQLAVQRYFYGGSNRSAKK